MQRYIILIIYKWNTYLKNYNIVKPVEDQFHYIYRAMSIILGQDAAWSSLIYIDYALDMPDSVHTTEHVRTFVSGDKLVVHIFNPKE